MTDGFTARDHSRSLRDHRHQRRHPILCKYKGVYEGTQTIDETIVFQTHGGSHFYRTGQSFPPGKLGEIVVLIYCQVAFMILESSKVFKETPKLSYADVHMGIPTMVICVQMVPFAIFIRYAFSTKVYRVNAAPSDAEEKLTEVNEHGRPVPRSYQGGPFGIYAWLAYYNPMEYIREVQSMYRTLHHVHVRNQKRIYKEDVEGESVQTSVEESQSESELVALRQNQSGQSGYEHNEPFEQVQLAQSQPLMHQVQYPAQSHYVQDGYENVQGSLGGNMQWGQDQHYGRPYREI